MKARSHAVVGTTQKPVVVHKRHSHRGSILWNPRQWRTVARPEPAPLLLHLSSENIRRNAKNTPGGGTALVVVYGFLCNMSPARLQQHLENILKAAHSSVTSVDVVCDNLTTRVVKNIAKKTFSKNGALNTTAFVQSVQGLVRSRLRAGSRVLLMGHSYGGSVVARVFGTLTKREQHLVKAVTFGSIHVSPNTQVHHVMYKYDIAWLCHARSPKCDTVHILPPETGQGPVRQHVSYAKHILDFASRKWF